MSEIVKDTTVVELQVGEWEWAEDADGERELWFRGTVALGDAPSLGAAELAQMARDLMKLANLVAQANRP
jgi:hypothetical protein